jgi:hypothetical protein
MKSAYHHRSTLRLISGLIVVWTSSSGHAAAMTPDQRVFFENKIRPVLVKQCYECHSATAKKLGGKLLLDSPSEMISGGESGPSVSPGYPDKSLIIQALKYDGIEMPPQEKLPDQVIQDFITWVNMGAPDPREATPKTAIKQTPTDKAALWSYQPLSQPKTPLVRNKEWPRDPVDTFILAKMEARSLKPAPSAATETLIRRLCFDLIGLPPQLSDLAGLSEWSDEKYAALVDRLLASRHYGEHWGRHWLDVARFAESNGNDGLSRNASFPHAWRYRDYVIQAFNEDRPYDVFVKEQIAGDLLPADSLSQRDRQLIATGFLAIGSKPAKAMNDNFEMDVVADQINVIGHGILGLSIGCARCHDHKTEPIPTRDYYALAGIFKSSETLWGAAAHQGLTAHQTALHPLKKAPRVKPRAEVELIIKGNKPSKTPAKSSFNYAVDAALAMGIRDAKTIADCKLNIGGESKKLGPAVPRGFLSASSIADTEFKPSATQSGRLQLAEWLTHPQHPQTARVMTNRVWLHLFGEGLVRTPDDFGISGERPTHPELLDHLTNRFIQSGWSIKQLIRDIVLSRTYQQSSQASAESLAADPENLLQTRHQRRRLSAESVRDAILVASGSLNPQPGLGSLIQHRDVLINELAPLHQPSDHRSIYLLLLRNSMPPELTPFNLPDALTVTGKRNASTLATQSLYLLNNDFIVKQSATFASRLISQTKNDATRLHQAYRQALTRQPTNSENQRDLDWLHEMDLTLVSEHPDTTKREKIIWAAFCQALLASNELRYVD